jgi:hypothetical protein
MDAPLWEKNILNIIPSSYRKSKEKENRTDFFRKQEGEEKKTLHFGAFANIIN